jgi:CheY-like chemotaxis protein
MQTSAGGVGGAAGVLVVDDDSGIRRLVSEALEDEGLRVAQAENGAEALLLAERARPAVILLDMQMPVMDGWAFARAYRSRPGPHAKIVVMTAARDARRVCDEIGGDEWLPKPFDVARLVEVVERLGG